MACAEENHPGNPIAEAGAYTQLAVGNYWIYDKYVIDTMGNETALHSIDSIYIEKDTVINGETYFKMIEPAYSITTPYPLGSLKKEIFLKDSLHYLVTTNHHIIFSSMDFNTILSSYYTYALGSDSAYIITTQMQEVAIPTTTPAGTFNTLIFNKKLVFLTTACINLYGDSLEFKTKYAKNVGMLVMPLPMLPNQTTKIERRLVRYHVNE